MMTFLAGAGRRPPRSWTLRAGGAAAAGAALAGAAPALAISFDQPALTGALTLGAVVLLLALGFAIAAARGAKAPAARATPAGSPAAGVVPGKFLAPTQA